MYKRQSLYFSALETARADISPFGAALDDDASSLQVGFPGVPIFVLRMAARITGSSTLVADDSPSSHVSYPH